MSEANAAWVFGGGGCSVCPSFPQAGVANYRYLTTGFLTIGLCDKVIVVFGGKARQSDRAGRDKVIVDNSFYPNALRTGTNRAVTGGGL